jgi:hypothetical protein
MIRHDLPSFAGSQGSLDTEGNLLKKVKRAYCGDDIV